MTFGSILKQLRAERNMLQKDLAKLLGISSKTISGYERDERRPDMKTLQDLASIFGVTVDYLIGKSDNKNNSHFDVEKEFPEGVKVLRRATNELTQAQRVRMIELMEWFLKTEGKED